MLGVGSVEISAGRDDPYATALYTTIGENEAKMKEIKWRIEILK
jgi:hypothetical protein